MRHILRFVAIVGLVWLIAPVPAVTQYAYEWDVVYLNDNSFFQEIDCADSLNCGAVAHIGEFENILVVTTDGGNTWESHSFDIGSAVPPFFLPPRPHTVANPSPTVFYIGGDSGVIWRTYDRGRTFEKVRTPLKGAVEVRMWDDARGIGEGGDMSNILVTRDGWKTWERLPIPDSLASLIADDIVLTEEGAVWIFAVQRPSYYKRLLATTIDGMTWIRRDVPQDMGDLEVSPDGIMVLVGEPIVSTVPERRASRISVSLDTGRTWIRTLDTIRNPEIGLSGASFAHGGIGVACGRFGEIWSTIDGGMHWNWDTLLFKGGYIPSFKSVYCFDNGTCLGAMGTNAITRNRRLTSGIRLPLPEESMYAAAFPNPTSGFVNVTAPVPFTGAAGVVIRDILGRVVPDVPAPTAGASEQEWRIDLRGLPLGMYVIEVRSGDTRTIAKVVKVE